MKARLVEAFHWLHRHPELAMKEHKTTEYLRKILLNSGVRLLDTKLETGLIAVIGTGEAPVIALRADIDALPIQEQTSLPYASETPGVMHACGHDFHAACMLGAALLLKEREASLRGTVKVIFQPAEEVNRGADLVMDTGLLDDIQLFLAGHTYPWYPAGTLGIRPGPVMASADRFSVCIRGKGCHAANPDMGIDPIPALGAVISGFQTIVSRRINPFDSAVVSITRVEAGSIDCIMSNLFYTEEKEEAIPFSDVLFEVEITAMVRDDGEAAQECTRYVYKQGLSVQDSNPPRLRVTVYGEKDGWS